MSSWQLVRVNTAGITLPDTLTPRCCALKQVVTVYDLMQWRQYPGRTAAAMAALAAALQHLCDLQIVSAPVASKRVLPHCMPPCRHTAACTLLVRCDHPDQLFRCRCGD
jgi:hypothetical protein